MRVLITAVLLLVAAETVDTLYFGGSYRDAAVQAAQYQGQQFRDQVNSFIHNNLDP